MKKGLLAGLALAVAALLLVLFLKSREQTSSPAASGSSAAKPAGEPAGTPGAPVPRPASRAIAPSSTAEPPPGTAPPPPPPPEDTDNPTPPPLTGLILTFPEGVTDQVVQEHYAKCQVNELRRSGNFAKVMPKDGVSVDAVKKCFQFTEVTIGEERGGPPPGVR
jgi:hypothetical protein